MNSIKKMKFRQALFWDTNPKKIDTKKHAQYIIEKVADFGHDNEVRWTFDFYKKPFIRKVITKSRCLRPRTKTLWTLLLKN
jgi:hypothetical protein